MDILKLLPPHNTMSKKNVFLTPNLNCAKHNARNKHKEPYLEFSYASRSTSFYVKPLLLNGIRYQFVQSNSR